MTKSDLKTGMVVETRSGSLGLILGKAICTFTDKGSKGGYSISCYTEDLLSNECGMIRWDIMKVYAEARNLSGADLQWYLERPSYLTAKLLWKRPELMEELTLEQVCKELGRDIKIVK